MSNGNNFNSETFASRTKIYLIIIALLIITISILNYKLIPIGIVIYALLITYTIWTNKKRKAELSEQLKDLTINVNTTAKTTLINSPFPLAIIETNGNMVWKSEKFVSEFANIDINDSLNELLKKIKLSIESSDNQSKNLNKGNINTDIEIKNKYYKVYGSYVKSKEKSHQKENKYTTILYFIDYTEIQKLKKEMADTSLCLGIMMIDNYEEISQRLPTEAKTILMAKVEQEIYSYAERFNSIIIKNDRDTFYFITSYSQLEEMIKDKISILDDIKKVETPELPQATLSIAFSTDGKNFLEKANSAREVIDIVLGRGGDQAIIKKDGKYEFFGGISQEVEKRTRVKSRMISHALKELIEDSDNVLIMGHTNGDMDSIGSAMGLYRLTISLGKEAKIVNGNTGIGLNKFINAVKRTGEYSECFVTEEKATEFVKDKSLLIVVDTNKKTYVDAPILLEKIPRVVVIDHHRRSTDYIENTILTFHEVYASSASELVTEILEYSQLDMKLTDIEKEALYAGIMLDTKNFTFKTGVRTFEACAYLRKCGVDIIKVKKWFQSDLETYQTISEIVSKSEILNENIAISIYDKDDENANIIAAKAADELLTIGGITASFVLGRIGNKVYISGRSIGEINVQIILEKLGGGGHITLAGAQLEDISLEDAKQELINRINEYLFETSKT